MIDISALRESYTSGQFTRHVSSEYNLADPLTKKTTAAVLDKLLSSGKVNPSVNFGSFTKKIFKNSQKNLF